MTIVTYFQKVTEAEFQTIGPLYMWYLPFTNSPRKHTVTYHFSDLPEVYSGNRQIQNKMSVAIFTPTHMSLCNNSSDNKRNWIHRINVTTVTYMHQSQPSLHLLLINLTVHLELWPDNHLIWCNATLSLYTLHKHTCESQQP